MFQRNNAISTMSPLLSRYCETMGEMTLRDYTEKALAAAKVESDLANKTKSSFLGTMSHELRTPLNAIIGFSEIIGNTAGHNPDGAVTLDFAQQITKAGRHMLGIINDILDMSKLESGTFQLNLEDYNIGEIVEDSIPLVRERINTKQQILDVKLAKNLPKLSVDARRIRQVLINLLSNAHKFTPEGGRITVSARSNQSGGVTIAVVDTGIGMTPEQMAVAVQPFGQVQSMYTRTEEGSGLGLAIARAIAQQHGGDIYLESEPDVGTAAVLTLRGAGAMALKYAHPVNEGGGERRQARRPTIATKEKPE
jgi:signal transduction histidine kinase